MKKSASETIFARVRCDNDKTNLFERDVPLETKVDVTS